MEIKFVRCHLCLAPLYEGGTITALMFSIAPLYQCDAVQNYCYTMIDRFVDKEFKERGLGDVKILKHNVTGKKRVILRREKVLKLACNHMLNSDMNLRPMENSSGKAWVWYALDFSDGMQTEELLAIK